jgi:hypothetical protein
MGGPRSGHPSRHCSSNGILDYAGRSCRKRFPTTWPFLPHRGYRDSLRLAVPRGRPENRTRTRIPSIFVMRGRRWVLIDVMRDRGYGLGRTFDGRLRFRGERACRPSGGPVFYFTRLPSCDRVARARPVACWTGMRSDGTLLRGKAIYEVIGVVERTSSIAACWTTTRRPSTLQLAEPRGPRTISWRAERPDCFSHAAGISAGCR